MVTHPPHQARLGRRLPGCAYGRAGAGRGLRHRDLQAGLAIRRSVGRYRGAINPSVMSDRSLRLLFVVWGVAHLAFGIAGAAFPRWFFGAVPPWPPLHVGQIQIAGIFDLAMATAFLIAATDVARYAPLMIAAGVVEIGRASCRERG